MRLGDIKTAGILNNARDRIEEIARDMRRDLASGDCANCSNAMELIDKTIRHIGNRAKELENRRVPRSGRLPEPQYVAKWNDLDVVYSVLDGRIDYIEPVGSRKIRSIDVKDAWSLTAEFAGKLAIKCLDRDFPGQSMPAQDDCNGIDHERKPLFYNDASKSMEIMNEDGTAVKINLTSSDLPRNRSGHLSLVAYDRKCKCFKYLNEENCTWEKVTSEDPD